MLRRASRFYRDEDLANFVDDWLVSGIGLPGDLSGDDEVDFVDYCIFASYWIDYPDPSGLAVKAIDRKRASPALQEFRKKADLLTAIRPGSSGLLPGPPARPVQPQHPQRTRLPLSSPSGPQQTRRRPVF